MENTMNERIKELAEQARDWGYAEHSGYTAQLLFEEKFAELIIGHATECVRDVLREEDSELTYTAASQVQKRIKQYFGVEE
jgi:hypothetical protein